MAGGGAATACDREALRDPASSPAARLAQSSSTGASRRKWAESGPPETFVTSVDGLVVIFSDRSLPRWDSCRADEAK